MSAQKMRSAEHQLRASLQKLFGKGVRKRGLLQNCFPVSAATVLKNISLKTIHAGGFRCAPEERGITACGLAHRLWIYPRFCALQERGSRLTVASLPHFMCRRHFRISPSAFRLPHFAFRLPPSAFLLNWDEGDAEPVVVVPVVRVVVVPVR